MDQGPLPVNVKHEVLMVNSFDAVKETLKRMESAEGVEPDTLSNEDLAQLVMFAGVAIDAIAKFKEWAEERLAERGVKIIMGGQTRRPMYPGERNDAAGRN